jgi:hypothetical protein
MNAERERAQPVLHFDKLSMVQLRGLALRQMLPADLRAGRCGAKM